MDKVIRRILDAGKLLSPIFMKLAGVLSVLVGGIMIGRHSERKMCEKKLAEIRDTLRKHQKDLDQFKKEKTTHEARIHTLESLIAAEEAYIEELENEVEMEKAKASA